MNEVRYRAWERGHNKIFDVEAIDFAGRTITLRLNSEMTVTTNIKNVELLQLTGVMDVNGKEICEGDIVKVETYNKSKITSVIQFLDGGFCLFTQAELLYYEWLGDVDGDIEIIGNVYEEVSEDE